MPSVLAINKEWWKGPAWLQFDKAVWPLNDEIDIEKEKIPERKASCALAIKAEEKKFYIYDRFSSCNRLIRVITYCLRFIEKCKNSKTKKLSVNNTKIVRLKVVSLDSVDYNSIFLTVKDIKRTNEILIKQVQAAAFAQEISSIKTKGAVNKNSSILKLSPFLDGDNILRVGGRLKCTSLPFNVIHPIVLPGKHPFTTLIIRNEHERSNHSGAYNTLSLVRQNYWPCSGRDVVRSIVKKCGMF